MEKQQLIKRRDFREILNDSSEFITQNFRTYSAGFLNFILPPLVLLIMILIFAFYGLMHSGLNEYSQKNYMSKILTVSPPTFISLILLLCVAYVLQSLLAYEFILLYEEKLNPAEITTQELWARMKAGTGRMIRSYIGLFFMFLLFWFAAAILIVIASFIMAAISNYLVYPLYVIMFAAVIYFLFPISMFFMIRMREGLGVTDAINRCMYLNSGHWWRTFGVMLIVSIVAWCLKMMFVAPLYIFQGLVYYHFLYSSKQTNQIIDSVIQIISLVAGLYFSVITHFVTAFNYYTLLEEKDDTILMQEINRIGENTEAQPPQEGSY